MLAFIPGTSAANAQAGTNGNGVNTFYGGYQEHIALEVPRFQGIEPKLSLDYNSSSGNGFVGVGWRLQGFSTLERMSPGKGAPTYGGSDLYFLDGQELLPCAAGSTSPSCTTGGTHSAKIENYLRIKYDGASNRWELTQKDGTRATFDALYTTAGGTLRWGLSRVTDTKGNTVTYGWWCDGSPHLDCYPSSVAYNGTTLTLHRELRPDVVTFANGRSLGRTSYRLKTLDVQVSGSRVRAYKLAYTTSGGTSRSMLASVQQFGRDASVDAAGTVTSGTALPAMSYGYTASALAFTAYNDPIATAAINGSGGELHVGDYNGDGRSDAYVYWPSSGTNRLFLSNGSGTFTAYNDPIATAAINGSGGQLHVGDYNGDGRSDAYVYWPSSGTNRLFLSNGNGTFTAYNDPIATAAINGSDSHTLHVGDYNGGGRSDVYAYWPTSGTNRLFLSNGNGTFTSSFDPIATAALNGSDSHTLYVGDYNGDGRSDAYVYWPSSGTNRLFLSNGNGTFTSSFDPIAAAALNGSDSHTLHVGDYNGDGRSDVYVYWPSSGTNRLFLGAGATPDLLASVSNGLGGTTTVSYGPSSSWANTYLPVSTVLYAVTAVTTSDGRGSSATTRYQYTGGLWSAAERRFLGYRKVTSVLDAAGNYTETYYHQHVGCISKPEVTYHRDAAGNLYKYSTFGYSENTAPPYTSLMTQRWEYECNQSASCRRTLLQVGYDEYGNGYLTYEHGDYDVAGDERTSLRGVYPNKSAYLVGLPAYENIYAGIGTSGTLLKQTLNEYDGNGTYAAAPTVGQLTRQRAWNNQTGGYILRGFGYDAWGNRTSETDERGALTTHEYDSTYHLYETRRCNALGQCSTKTWDGVLGLVKSETDINGNLTTSTHDALGRPLQTRLPDGSTKSFSYLDWGNPQLQRIRQTFSDGSADGLWTDVYEDGLGRRYKTVKKGGLVQETLYNDGSTRVWKKSSWYGPGETPQYQVFAFDGLGRLRTVTNPDGTRGQRVYGNGSVTSYDELGQERVTWFDASGQMTQVREKNGSAYQYTTYQYDLLGNLTRATDAAGNVSTTTWDSLGRKLTGCDPDTGCSSYTYDASGHLLTRRDAKGQTTAYTYDALGRVLTKTLADGRTSQWTYDEAGHGAGLGAMTSRVFPSGSESLSYDFAGRMTSTTKCVSGYCYTLQYGYDVAGRLAAVTYPDGERVTYGYDAAGRMASVSGYVQGFSYNGRGQLVSATYANGTTSRFTYSDARQWMSGASVTGPAGTLYQASYGYDAGGRVTSMSSASNPLSNLSFTYDGLNRLTGTSGAQAQAFTYDALGNITWSSQLGSHAYADGLHRHAVTSAGGATYRYDTNGNLLAGDGRTLEWDSDDRLAKVTTASGATTFAYDADGQRVVKSGPSGITRYFGPLLELGPNGLTRSYYAGPLLVARRDASGAYWYHQDHLGSVRAITHQAGNKVASYDYAPFGAVVAASASVSNPLGYGGHVTDETGLVYMNARYYDPKLGRFISPDSVVPSTLNPQALNRYAYVYNNPISNTDPTGHVPVVAAIATAVSVGMATGFAGTAFAISVIGAATMTAGYFLGDPVLMSIGGILLGAASAYTFGAGFLGNAQTAQAAWAGGATSALTSPISPLDSRLKQAIGWAYTAQSLFHEFKHLDENIQKGADKLSERFDNEELAQIREMKAEKLNALSEQDKALLNDSSSWKPWQKQYGEMVERVTGGAISAGEAIALNSTGGLVGPGGGLATQVLDTLTGWIPGVRAHSVLHDTAGFLRTSFDAGPGYLYVTADFFNMSAKNPLAGQVEGLTGTGGHSVSALFPRLF
ncbi:MAG TPA: FG-GAP-like repeat-containing protein [Archangium sp.]|uniref:FG-GAP-like repeat-containing protein n=1 Tax=Archangium sp. TaxID=1872627 RepID=UPI002E359D59|nr:FG-GAP-like repeat-containing protein [Archangium sp.]HEX5749738.1 FG-GAP-like repeat-containing protein [Archangium sp.]